MAADFQIVFSYGTADGLKYRAGFYEIEVKDFLAAKNNL
jgi:hypothetical protein